MIGVELILPALIAPAVIAAAIARLSLIARPPGRGPAWWGGSLAIGLAYACAHASLLGLPRLRPAPVEHWLLIVAGAASAAGLIIGRRSSPLQATLLGSLCVVAGGGAWLIVQQRWLISSWPLWACMSAALGVGIATGAAGAALDRLRRRAQQEGSCASVALALSVSLACSGGIVVLSGHAITLGALLAALGAAAGAIGLVSVWTGRPTLDAGAMVPLVTLGSLLWLTAWLWTSLEGWYVGVFALSAGASAVGEARALRGRPAWQRGLARIAASAAPVGIALGVELWRALGDEMMRSELGW